MIKQGEDEDFKRQESHEATSNDVSDEKAQISLVEALKDVAKRQLPSLEDQGPLPASLDEGKEVSSKKQRVDGVISSALSDGTSRDSATTEVSDGRGRLPVEDPGGRNNASILQGDVPRKKRSERSEAETDSDNRMKGGRQQVHSMSNSSTDTAAALSMVSNSLHHPAAIAHSLNAAGVGIFGGVNLPLNAYQQIQYETGLSAALLQQQLLSSAHLLSAQPTNPIFPPQLVAPQFATGRRMIDPALQLGRQADLLLQYQLLAARQSSVAGGNFVGIPGGLLASTSQSMNRGVQVQPPRRFAASAGDLPESGISSLGRQVAARGDAEKNHASSVSSLLAGDAQISSSGERVRPPYTVGSTTMEAQGGGSKAAPGDVDRRQERTRQMEQFQASEARTSSRSAVLYQDKDEYVLSDYQCLVRKQIEVFEASDDDVQFTISKMSKAVVPSQVGIRCKHCAAVLPQYARPKAAIYFPRSLDSMYQFGQNMVKNHLTKTCSMIPPATQKRLLELQEERKRGRGGRERWSEAAQEIGVIEKDGALFFREEFPTT